MMPDVDRSLHEANAAFVGKVVESRTVNDADPFGNVVLLFEVEGWVKGDLGKTVEIHTSSSSASCGIDAGIGRSGVFVYASGGKFTSGLCSIVSPEDLIAGGRVHRPSQDSTPPLVVANSGETGDGSANQLARYLFIGLGIAGIGGAAAIWVKERKNGPVVPMPDDPTG